MCHVGSPAVDRWPMCHTIEMFNIIPEEMEGSVVDISLPTCNHKPNYQYYPETTTVNLLYG